MKILLKAPSYQSPLKQGTYFAEFPDGTQWCCQRIGKDLFGPITYTVINQSGDEIFRFERIKERELLIYSGEKRISHLKQKRIGYGMKSIDESSSIDIKETHKNLHYRYVGNGFIYNSKARSGELETEESRLEISMAFGFHRLITGLNS